MIKRLARWILKDEVFTEECAEAIDDRFGNIESAQYLMQSLISRNESYMRKIREDMKILQTRQVNILNQIKAITDENNGQL